MTADWAMVIITGIYVVATIFICWANIKTAKASKEQLKEMQRQFAEANRAEIRVSHSVPFRPSVFRAFICMS